MKWLALFLIRVYQGVHLAFFRDCCRFHPTCSEYAAEAIDTHGLIKGVMLGSFRILRCQPFCKGGWDPVPRKPAPPATEGWSAFLPATTRRPIAGGTRFRKTLGHQHA